MPEIIMGQVRTDSISIKTKSVDEGYFYDEPIVTRCGVFEYHNPDGTIRRELRRPEDVFNPDSLESYVGKPIIITHNAGAVTKDNVTQHEVGTILSEGIPDGDYVRAKIVVHDTDAVKDSGYRELSLGYMADLIVHPGEWNGEQYDVIQTNIRVNHLALVAVARAGESARLNMDGESDKGETTMDNKDTVTNTDTAVVEPVTDSAIDEPTADSNAAPAAIDPVAFAAAMEAYMATHGGAMATKADNDEPAVVVTAEPDLPPVADSGADCMTTKDSDTEPVATVTDSDDSIEGITARRDAMEDCQAKTDITTLLNALANPTVTADSDDNDMKMDSADIRSIVRDRVEVCRLADKLHLDGVEEMSIRAAREKIIGVVMPELRLDGKDDTYVNALYDVAKQSINRRKSTADQLAQIFRADGGAKAIDAGPDAARERYIKRVTDNG